MDWFRIGRLEFYKASPGWYLELRSCCGCSLVSLFGIGVTLLGKSCRDTQGPKFFQAGKHEDLVPDVEEEETEEEV